MAEYKVTISPIIAPNTYGDGIDVTAYVKNSKGIGDIKSSIDAADFSVGVFFYEYVRLNMMNYDRRLSPPWDSRSIFKHARENSLVRIDFEGYSFSGLINEEVSREDDENVSFLVTSRESILRKANIGIGLVPSGTSFSDGIYTILNRPPINQVVTISKDEIILDFDSTIDDGDFFVGMSASEAINEILVVANSYLYCDFNGVIKVRPRDYNSSVRRTFYGPYDVLDRSPTILKVLNYNSGQNRAFNSFDVSGVIQSDQVFIDNYSFRRKDVSADFVTDVEKKRSIAANLVLKYKVPKIEMEIIVPTVEAGNITIGDAVSVNYDRLRRPAIGEKLIPKYSISKYTGYRYPVSKGSLKINENIRFIVYGRVDNPGLFTTTVKLREYGYRFDDSIIHSELSAYGEGTYGEAVYG